MKLVNTNDFIDKAINKKIYYIYMLNLIIRFKSNCKIDNYKLLVL